MKTAYTRDEHLAWLDATIELFSDPSRWTAKAWARLGPDHEMRGLDSYDDTFINLFDQATCYCVEGGLYKTALDLGYVDIEEDSISDLLDHGGLQGILVDLIRSKQFTLGAGHSYVNEYNDELGYEAVVALLKETREQIASQEAA